MKYRNAFDLLPDMLLREVQNYAGGEVIYIPISNRRKRWGEKSGTRNRLKRRNEAIRKKYSQKVGIKELAKEYHRSPYTIRNIIFDNSDKMNLY